MCRVLGAPPSAYYASLSRPPSKQAQANEELKPIISKAFVETQAIYGSPRMTKELRSLGYPVGHHRVARLMKEMELSARSKYVGHGMPMAENLYDR